MSITKNLWSVISTDHQLWKTCYQMFHLTGKQCTFLNRPLLVSTGFDAGNPGRSSWFLTGGCQKKDKRKTDINEPHLTMCPSSSLFYSYFSVMGALKDRMLRLMVGLQWTASHESILPPRGWLISVEAIRHPRYPFPTQHESVVNYSYSRDDKH